LADLDVDAVLEGGSGLGSDLTGSFQAQATLSGVAGVVAHLQVVIGFAAPVLYQAPARVCPSGRMVLDQVDLFLDDGITRAQDVIPADLQLRVYLNGAQLDWPLVTGVGIPDVRVTAGKVYWTEFSTGFYSIRFFPNVVGTWRVLLTYPVHDQAVSLSYAVAPQVRNDYGTGMLASFIRR
jgi:hypothetical protein